MVKPPRINAIEGLEVGNVLFVYTGESENIGLVRTLFQVFQLHENYTLKLAKKDHDVYLAQVYEQTLKKHGLYLILVRDGSSDKYEEIQTSEYTSKLVTLKILKFWPSFFFLTSFN